jgi:hypothetical protein
MKRTLCALAGCVIAGTLMLQPAHGQMTASSGSSQPPAPLSTYNPYIHDPSPAQLKAVWGDPNGPKSNYNPYIHDPTPAQLEAAWGKPHGQQSNASQPSH